MFSTIEGRMYDAWLTREPEYDEEPLPGDAGYPRCGRCGGWLTREPERVEHWEDAVECDGQPAAFTTTWTADDAPVLELIGWEHLGRERHDTYPAPCGDAQAHTPHRFVVAEGAIEHRSCRRCGEPQAIACG
jgi:hypothetical protein